MLCDRMEVGALWVVATAACRDTKNGNAFVTEAERSATPRSRSFPASARPSCARSARIQVPSARRHCRGSGWPFAGTVRSSRPQGSHRHHAAARRTGVAGRDRKSIKKAEKLARESLDDEKLLKAGANRTSMPSAAPGAARAAAHVADGLSPACHARLCPVRARSPRLRRSRPSGGWRDSVAGRGGRRCAAPVLAMPGRCWNI